MNIRKSGVFGDRNSGNGLYEGVPADAISRRTWMVNDLDFIQTADGGTVNWTTSQIVGTLATFLTIDDSVNGVARLAGAVTAGEGGSVQNDGSSATARSYLVPAAGRTIVAEFTVQNSIWNNVDWFIGLSVIDTTILDTDGVLQTAANMVGFHQLEGDTYFNIVHQGGASTITSTSSGITLTDATQYVFGIRIQGTSTVEHYWGTKSTSVLGEPGGTIWNTKRLSRATTSLAFSAGMAVTFGYVSNGTAPTFDFDRILTAQSR